MKKHVIIIYLASFLAVGLAAGILLACFGKNMPLTDIAFIGIASLGAAIGISQFAIHCYEGHHRRSQPTIQVNATVQAKLDTTQVGTLSGHSAAQQIQKYVRFATDDGLLVDLYMNLDQYYTLEAGDRGRLTYQGDRFWKFEKLR